MVRKGSSIGIRRAQLILTLLLATAVIASLLVSMHPAPVEARCYGRYAAKCRNYVARCRAQCGKTGSAIKACSARDLKSRLASCRTTAQQQLADCVGDRSCKLETKKSFVACTKAERAGQKRDIKAITKGGAGVPACNHCCTKTNGEGGCLGYFDNSRFYGSYRYHGLHCVQTPPGSERGAFLGVTDTVRAHLASLIPSLTSNWSE